MSETYNDNSRMSPILILVVPCYNEEEIIKKSAAVLADKIRRLAGDGTVSAKSRILFVDDGRIRFLSCTLCAMRIRYIRL